MGFLKKGSTVEVSREGKVLNGPWYVATILKSNYRAKGKCLIKYQTLVSDKVPNEFLTESVGISSIRPLPPPPPADQNYEPLDVVEAFHLDGWWKGIVSKVEVLEDKTKSRRYKVVLENSHQQLDFSSADMRFHWVLRGGKWVQSPKQKRMAGLKIVKGMAVEVNFDRDDLQDAWFPAIVLEEIGIAFFLVEYTRSGNDSDDIIFKEIVDLFHIRPLPPKLDIQNFETLECVEAFHDSCWKKGTIITILTHGRYDISFPCEKEEIRFSRSEIRPHLVWTNGNWACLRELPDGTRCGEQYANVDDIANYSEIVVPISCSSTAHDHKEDLSSCENANAKDAMNCAEEKCGSEQKNVSEGNTNETDFEDCLNKEAKLSEIENRTDKSLQKLDFRSKNLRFRLVHRDGKWVHKQKENPDRTQCKEQNADVDNIKKHSETVVPVTCSSTTQDHNEERSCCESTNDAMDYSDEKCGEQKNVCEGTASEMDFQEKSSCQNTSNATNYAEEKKCASDLEGNIDIVQKESNGTGQQDKDEQHNVSEGTAIAMDLEDCSSKAAELSKMEIEGDQEGTVDKFSVIQELPFKKSSSLWEYVNSVDVFRVLPQKPHFIPLMEHDEELREGIAIGHMLTFATLVERTSKLRVDKSRKVFESYLQVLDDLEMVGFDVKAVVNRINSLLSIKTQKEQLKSQSKCVHSRIAECDGEKPKAEGEIDDIDKMIDELKEARAVKSSENATIDSETSLLQKNADRINQHLENAKLHYESQVAQPW